MVQDDDRSLAEKILRGATAVADGVRRGLGGRLGLQDRSLRAPAELVEPAEQLGAQELREAAEQTGATVGDGTRTTAILAHAILDEGLGAFMAGAGVIGLRRGLERGLCVAIEALHGAAERGAGTSRGEELVPGAGLALLRTIEAVEREAVLTEGDERSGLFALARALESPVRQIAENWGLDPEPIVARMRAEGGNLGVDAATGSFVDLVEAGILDPTRVLCVALQNAVSVAGDLLLAEAALAATRSDGG